MTTSEGNDPSWLQYCQVGCVFIISVFTAWIAFCQLEIATSKWKHDLYERRYRVFDSIRTLLEEIFESGNIADGSMAAFLRATGDAQFLFDSKLSTYVMDIRYHAKRMRSIKFTVAAVTINNKSQEKAAAVAENEHREWLIRQIDGLDERFAHDLSLYKGSFIYRIIKNI